MYNFLWSQQNSDGCINDVLQTDIGVTMISDPTKWVVIYICMIYIITIMFVGPLSSNHRGFRRYRSLLLLLLLYVHVYELYFS